MRRIAVSVDHSAARPAQRPGPPAATRPRKPALAELGTDLLSVTPWERWSSLALPFVCAAGFFGFAWLEWWWAALLCAVVQCFFTYASVSHDLVHRTLGLPPRWNEWLLCGIELVCLRSGHAFRATHMHHHARFPADDDLEGRAAGMAWWRALLDGMTAQARQWRWAVGHASERERRWVLGEGAAIVVLTAGCAACWPLTHVPLAYAVVTVAGSWVFPLMTSTMPHDPSGDDMLTQTRLFRGRVVSVLAFEHLYHLEHHLYPHVPHHRWPELARRLDPYFARCGLKPTVLWR